MDIISIKEQMIALMAKTMLEILGDGDRMVQHILRAKIGDLSQAIWGCNDFSWLVDPGWKKLEEESTMWGAFCEA